MNLKTLFKKNGTDKGTHHQYYKIYDDLFKPYVNHNIQFCEIGVLNGNSLRSWSEYFTSAEIIGFDYQRFPNVADIKVHMLFLAELALALSKTSYFLVLNPIGKVLKQNY